MNESEFECFITKQKIKIKNWRAKELEHLMIMTKNMCILIQFHSDRSP